MEDFLTATKPTYEELERRIKKFEKELAKHKRTEEALRESIAKFQHIFNSDMTGIIFWDREGNITEANDAFLEMLGYSRDELLEGEVNWKEMTPPEYEYLDEKALQELSETGICKPFEKEYIKKDGSRFPILLGASVLEDTPDRGVCFVLDISDKQRFEAQLQQAQKMEAVGRLAGGVAHDFNNLLMSIIGNADLMLMGLAEDDPFREKLEQIKGGGKSAARLTRQLLAFSRKQILQPVVLDLNELIKGFAKMLERLIGEDVELETVLVSGLRQVEADPGQMEQIIMNLVINARDAMPDGGKLTIETANADLDEDYAKAHDVSLQPGPYVMLAVSDAGIGMDKGDEVPYIRAFLHHQRGREGHRAGLVHCLWDCETEWGIHLGLQ
ncbi:MAG: PAS domain S-box protein [Pseudomonadota bacterium]